MKDLVQYVDAADIPMVHGEKAVAVFRDGFGDICYITNLLPFADQVYIAGVIDEAFNQAFLNDERFHEILTRRSGFVKPRLVEKE